MVIPLPMFTAPSYGDRTLNEVQRCVNLYPEKTPEGYKLISDPGIEEWGTATNGEICRGVHYASVGRMFAIHNTTLYEIDSAGTYTSRGTIGTVSDPEGQRAWMEDNGLVLLIRTGGGSAVSGYTFTFATNTLAAIADADFPVGLGTVAFSSNYFIANKQLTGRLYVSDIDSGTAWEALSFVNAKSNPDFTVGVFSLGQTVFAFGDKSIDGFYDTGATPCPFEPISGLSFNVGTVAVDTVARVGESLCFLSQGQTSKIGISILSGNEIRRVSTPYIDSLLDVYTSNAFGFGYSREGHDFYQITVPALDKSFVYDLTEGTWRERDSNVSSSYVENRVRFMIAGFDPKYLYAFDRLNAKSYRVSNGYNSEAGTAIRRLRGFGPIQAGASRMFHSRIRFVLEVDHDSSAAYTLEATLDWTDDGGLTYSTARTLSKAITSGTTGQRVLLEAHRLGSSRQRYYRLILTGPAARIVLQSAELEADVGRN